MKVLVAMPCVNNVHVTTECLDSIVNHPVDILLCQNGATPEIKELFASYAKEYSHKIVGILDVVVNDGLNPALNMFLYYFLEHPEYTHMAIINSDIILNRKWLKIITSAIRHYGEEISWMPTEVDKLRVFGEPDMHDLDSKEIKGGVPGIFMWFTRRHAAMVYPMPKEIKIWFGDNWAYDIYRGVGYHTMMLKNLWCFHHGSSTIKTLESTSPWIEADKVAWSTMVEPMMKAKINELRGNV